MRRFPPLLRQKYAEVSRRCQMLSENVEKFDNIVVSLGESGVCAGGVIVDW
jgi:hypothetical protein